MSSKDHLITDGAGSEITVKSNFREKGDQTKLSAVLHTRRGSQERRIWSIMNSSSRGGYGSKLRQHFETNALECHLCSTLPISTSQSMGFGTSPLNKALATCLLRVSPESYTWKGCLTTKTSPDLCTSFWFERRALEG